MSNNTNKAIGAKTKTKSAIVQDLVNINKKINTLNSHIASEKKQIKRLREIQRELINGLQILAITKLEDIDNSEATKKLVGELNKKSDEAKKEAKKLEDTAKKLAAFEKMLSNITSLIAAIVKLVV